MINKYALATVVEDLVRELASAVAKEVVHQLKEAEAAAATTQRGRPKVEPLPADESGERRGKLVYRPKELAKRLGVSRMTVYRMAREGRFPRPIKLSAGYSGWMAEDVEKWLRARAAGREWQASNDQS